MHEANEERMLTVPDGVDAKLLEKVMSNPEMLTLLASLAEAAEK